MSTKARRKRRATKALSDYNKWSHEAIETNAVDLMTDMLHLFGYKKFQELLKTAYMHYTAEASLKKRKKRREDTPPAEI